MRNGVPSTGRRAGAASAHTREGEIALAVGPGSPSYTGTTDAAREGGCRRRATHHGGCVSVRRHAVGRLQPPCGMNVDRGVYTRMRTRGADARELARPLATVGAMPMQPVR